MVNLGCIRPEFEVIHENKTQPYFYPGYYKIEEIQENFLKIKTTNLDQIGEVVAYEDDFVIRYSKTWNSWCLLDESVEGKPENFILEIRRDLEGKTLKVIKEFMLLCAQCPDVPNLIKTLEKEYSKGLSLMNYTGEEHVQRVEAFLKGVKRELSNVNRT